MAKQAFTLWDDQTFDNSVVTGDGTFELGVSTAQTNSVGLKSLKLILEYRNIVPDFGAVPQTFDIDAEVEGRIGNKWFPVAYQFRAFRNPENGPTRIVQLQPTISGFDAGVDDIIFVGDKTVARVSRQQGNLPDSEFRVKLLVTERDFGGPGSFQSVVISAFGESFDV